MPSIEVEIELFCERCGKGICALGTATQRRGQPCFQVEPCPNCLEKEDADAFSRGHAEGYEEARKRFEHVD